MKQCSKVLGIYENKRNIKYKTMLVPLDNYHHKGYNFFSNMKKFGTGIAQKLLLMVHYLVKTSLNV